MLQYRRRGSNDPYYAFSRDIAYLWPYVIDAAKSLWDDNREPWLGELLAKFDASEKDLADVVNAYWAFLQIAREDPSKTCQEALYASGLLLTQQAARAAFYYMVGTIMTGTFFQGVREAANPGNRLDSVDELLAAAQRFVELHNPEARKHD